MKGKQGKKPNFLVDINRDILEDLTEDGNVKNIVGLAGILKELDEVKDICGLEFNGYLVKVEIPRPSGIIDEVVVAFAERAVDRGRTGDGIRVKEYFMPGKRLLISGQQQTLKDFSSGKVQVFILADYIGRSPKALPQNDAAFIGELAYKPILRETSRGKNLDEIYVKTENALTGGYSFIPCICWQEQAEEVVKWRPGDKVKLYGRCQSRKYSKLIDDITGERETRTAYEISVHLIKKEGEA